MTRKNEEYIGTIPKSIFLKIGKNPVEGSSNTYICNVEPGEIKLDFGNGYLWALVQKSLLLLGVSNRKFDGNPSQRNPDIYIQRLVIEAIVPAFLYQGYELNGITGSWEGWGINFNQYWQARGEGISKAEAAKTTWTYNKIAVPLGFSRVYLVNEKKSREVTAKFLRPRDE